jgi:hypothetical protein
VDEVGSAIIANTPALKAQSGIPHGHGGNSRKSNVDGFRLHVETVASDARVLAAGAQELVAPWRSVSTDDIDLLAGMVQRRRQVVEEVKQVRIEMMHFACTMVAEMVVEFG